MTHIYFGELDGTLYTPVLVPAMSPQSFVRPLPTLVPVIVQRFESMKRTALETNSNDLCGLPALGCGVCGRCTSFGGCDNWNEHLFTTNDVCRCALS